MGSSSNLFYISWKSGLLGLLSPYVLKCRQPYAFKTRRGQRKVMAEGHTRVSPMGTSGSGHSHPALCQTHLLICVRTHRTTSMPFPPRGPSPHPLRFLFIRNTAHRPTFRYSFCLPKPTSSGNLFKSQVLQGPRWHLSEAIPSSSLLGRDHLWWLTALLSLDGAGVQRRARALPLQGGVAVTALTRDRCQLEASEESLGLCIKGAETPGAALSTSVWL